MLPPEIRILISSILLLSIVTQPAWPDERIRIGVLPYGTLNWEMETIQKQKLDAQHGIRLEIRTLANPQAGKIALQSDAVDLIVSDWIWVSRQRSKGADYTFSPYSTTSGALVVPPDSKIHSVKDLPSKRIGIAGGELDKNWLLLIALAKNANHIDLDNTVEKVFGAPPLLSQQLHQNNLDAVLTYWHYAARLETLGYREILDGASILSGLGYDQPLPTLGYVFREEWARQNLQVLRNFLAASTDAKNLLCESDPVWMSIANLMESDDQVTRKLFRIKYCAGRIKKWTAQQKTQAASVFSLLHEIAGARLTGRSPTLAAGTFWDDGNSR